MKGRRKQLRNKSTPEEKMLWQKLKGNKLGRKFIRQYSIDNNVVDFYCPARRLAIEIDGELHKDNQKYDQYRTRYLGAFGIRVIRFWNNEVKNELEKVVSKIKENVSPPAPS